MCAWLHSHRANTMSIQNVCGCLWPCVCKPGSSIRSSRVLNTPHTDTHSQQDAGSTQASQVNMGVGRLAYLGETPCTPPVPAHTCVPACLPALPAVPSTHTTDATRAYSWPSFFCVVFVSAMFVCERKRREGRREGGGRRVS